MYGSYATIQDQPTLTFERRLSHPVDRVWQAITRPVELEQWFPSRVEFDELTPGAGMTFRFEHMPIDAPTTITGSVTDFDPPHLFAFYWGDDHLRLELEPLEEGCLLRLTVVLDAENKAARDSAGWHMCLDQLEGLMAGEKGPADTGANGGWHALYEEYQRRGAPAGAEIPGE